MTTGARFKLETAADYVGREIGLSEWLRIEQSQVDTFAAATLDPDWMHVDVERSRRETPFGGTIAQGFLVLSLMTQFWGAMEVPDPDIDMALNYGLNRVRFLAPVKVGSRIRLRSSLVSIQPRGESRYLLQTHNVVELEHSDTPAMVCDWLTLWFKTSK